MRKLVSENMNELQVDSGREVLKRNKLCCFIIPYFGKLPNTMLVFLQTCKYNTKYNWILFTDDHAPFEYPDNVKVIYLSFLEFRDRIQKCFDFEISLENPKKLCDYKPAYGYILSEELQEYQFWGYCDLDQYFGDLSKYISAETLEKYDKLFSLGHMTIYRNTESINTVFMKDLEVDARYKSYREIFSNKKNFVFDEWPDNTVNINVLAEQQGLRICYDTQIGDIAAYRSSFNNIIFEGGGTASGASTQLVTA